MALTGRGCRDFDLAALRAAYRTVVQSYRLLGCDGQALPWADAKHYSAAGVGLDRSGSPIRIKPGVRFSACPPVRRASAVDPGRRASPPVAIPIPPQSSFDASDSVTLAG